METLGGERILCSVKNEFGTEVFGGGRRKVRWGGRRKSVQWEGEEEGGILYSGKRRRKEEFCIKDFSIRLFFLAASICTYFQCFISCILCKVCAYI